MKINILMPFNRFGNTKLLKDLLSTKKVKWIPLTSQKIGFSESWIEEFPVNADNEYEPAYYKLNVFIKSSKIIDDEYYHILMDDDSFEPEFYDKLREKDPKEDVVVVSMLRGDNFILTESPKKRHPCSTLFASPENMKECCVGVEQLIIKGSFFKKMLFERHHNADGRLAETIKLKTEFIVYFPDLFVWFNYFEDGRYNSFNKCTNCGICCHWGIIKDGVYERLPDKCKYLNEKNLCEIYYTRNIWKPKWCRTIEEAKAFDEFKYFPETCGYKKENDVELGR